jgi:hypothetical protein
MLNVRTHRGEDVAGGARGHYEAAMRALREADSRDWVFQADEWRRARGEAERWLWAARCLVLEGMMG